MHCWGPTAYRHAAHPCPAALCPPPSPPAPALLGSPGQGGCLAQAGCKVWPRELRTAGKTPGACWALCSGHKKLACPCHKAEPNPGSRWDWAPGQAARQRALARCLRQLRATPHPHLPHPPTRKLWQCCRDTRALRAAPDCFLQVTSAMNKIFQLPSSKNIAQLLFHKLYIAVLFQISFIHECTLQDFSRSSSQMGKCMWPSGSFLRCSIPSARSVPQAGARAGAPHVTRIMLCMQDCGDDHESSFPTPGGCHFG